MKRQFGTNPPTDAEVNEALDAVCSGINESWYFDQATRFLIAETLQVPAGEDVLQALLKDTYFRQRLNLKARAL